MQECVIRISQEFTIPEKKLGLTVSWLFLGSYLCLLEIRASLKTRTRWYYLLFAIQAFLSFAEFFFRGGIFSIF